MSQRIEDPILNVQIKELEAYLDLLKKKPLGSPLPDIAKRIGTLTRDIRFRLILPEEHDPSLVQRVIGLLGETRSLLNSISLPPELEVLDRQLQLRAEAIAAGLNGR